MLAYSAQAALDQALDHHRGGRLAEAARLYRQVLEASPDAADAWHLLGMIARHGGGERRAADLIRRAAALDPASLPIWHNLAGLLSALGAEAEGLRAQGRLPVLAPFDAGVRHARGVALQRSGDSVRAADAYRAAVALDPAAAASLSNLGSVAFQAGRPDEAMRAARRALLVAPDLCGAGGALGMLRQARGDLDGAERAFRHAVLLEPAEGAALGNLGIVRALRDGPAVAEPWFRRAVAAAPGRAKLRFALASALQEMGRDGEARTHYHVGAAHAAAEVPPLWFAQFGEDRVIDALLGGPRDGFYVDVGAHHPFRHSNTLAFSLRGWRGINVDATPGTMAPFAVFRERDVNLECAVSDRPGAVTLRLHDDVAYNGIGEGPAEGMRTVTVQAVRLDALLDCHLPPGTTIDVLSVDVEGHDAAVLASNDWSRHRPRVVAVEDHGFREAEPEASATWRILDAAGYRYAGSAGPTRLFVGDPQITGPSPSPRVDQTTMPAALSTSQDALGEAFVHHQAGRLAEAGALYRSIIDGDPDHPDALHLLGLIERRRGNTEAAIGLIRRAVAVRTDFLPAYANLADVLLCAGRHDEAADCLRALIGRDAANPQWHTELSRVLLAGGRTAEATDAFRRAVELKPEAVDLRLTLMGLLHNQGRHAEADAVFADYRRRVPPALVPFQHVPAARWCRTVPDVAAMLAEPDTRWVARPAEGLPVDPPDFYLEDDDLTAPGFTDGQTVDMRRHVLQAGDTFIAHLRDVTIETVSRLHGLRGTFNLFVDRGLALPDAYHDQPTTERLLRFTGERSVAEVAGRRVELDLYDAAPPDQTVEGPAVLMASRYTHHNYFHWMFEGVARLWCLEALPGGDRLPLLMHAGANRGYHRDVLAALGMCNPVVPLTGTMVRVNRLYFPSFQAPGVYARPSIDWLRQRLLPAFGVQPWPRGGRRIYLSRADAGVRSLGNEDEMLRVLAAHGFEVVVPGRMTAAEQIRTFAEAAIVVAPHGAGNTNMIFAPPGATLLELVPQSTRALLYWMTAKQSGQRYGRLLCPEDRATGRLHVDVPRFAALLDRALAAR